MGWGKSTAIRRISSLSAIKFSKTSPLVHIKVSLRGRLVRPIQMEESAGRRYEPSDLGSPLRRLFCLSKSVTRSYLWPISTYTNSDPTPGQRVKLKSVEPIGCCIQIVWHVAVSCQRWWSFVTLAMTRIVEDKVLWQVPTRIHTSSQRVTRGQRVLIFDGHSHPERSGPSLR